MTFKIPEVSEDVGRERNDRVEPHYFTWSCGCRTRIESKWFVIIPCSADCGIYRAVMEEGAKNAAGREERPADSCGLCELALRRVYRP